MFKMSWLAKITGEQMILIGRRLTVGVIFCAVLVSCAKREKILEGERLDLRAPILAEGEVLPEPEVAAVRIDKLILASPVKNAQWTHLNGASQHLIRQPVLASALRKVWTVNIGKGNSSKGYITATPIVADARVYTMDAHATVRAFTTSGKAVWSQNLTPENENTREGSGGGLAFGQGVVAATTGHGEIVALDSTTGNVLWRQKIGGAISAGPVIVGDKIVAVSRNHVALGLNIKTGRIIWQQLSTGDTAGVAGAGSPAALDNLVVVPFASGEIVGTVISNGLRAWSTSLTGGNPGLARTVIADISGDPVIDELTIYVANQSGRLAALERTSGNRIWTVNYGSSTPVWPAGGAVFMVTDNFALKRLNASDGTEVWSVDLPNFKAKRDKWKRATYAYFGPILAGNLLWVAGSDGLLRSYSPQDGALKGTVKIPGGAASQPAVAGGTLYVLSTNGKLHAYR